MEEMPDMQKTGKRVTYPKKTKLRFTYGQKTLETYIRFIDDSILKKSLQRSR
mgnify:FL=1